MQTSIDLEFGDGVYIFRLPIKQIIALETKAGPIDAVRHRLMHGGFSIQDVTETIRHGLIGGGKGMVNDVEIEVGELKANQLIAAYIDGKPLTSIALVAKAVIGALYVGYIPERAQKKRTSRKKSQGGSTGASSPTTASPSG